MKLRRLLRNDRGELTFFSICVVMSINILIAVVLLYSTVRINSMNIRNAVKMELNNLSASIYSDTYRSQREANLSEYWGTLYSSHSYKQFLKQSVVSGLQEKIDLQNESYRLKNISLEFTNKSDRIEYEFSCDVEFYIKMFGSNYPVITQDIVLTGYHITKF